MLDENVLHRIIMSVFGYVHQLPESDYEGVYDSLQKAAEDVRQLLKSIYKVHVNLNYIEVEADSPFKIVYDFYTDEDRLYILVEGYLTSYGYVEIKSSRFAQPVTKSVVEYEPT